MAIIEKIKISDEGIATLKKLKDEHKTFKDEVKSTRDELKKAWDHKYKPAIETTSAMKSIRAMQSKANEFKNNLKARFHLEDNAALIKLNSIYKSMLKLSTMTVAPIVKIRDHALSKLKSTIKLFNDLKNKTVSPVIKLKDSFTSKANKIKAETKWLAKTVARPAVLLKDMISSKLSPVKVALKTLTKKAYTATITAVNKTASGISSTMKSLAKIGKKLVVPVTVVATGTAAALGAAVKSGMTLENQQVSIEHFIGATNKDYGESQIKEAAKTFTEQLRQNANATPFETGEVIQAGSRAVAITQGNTKSAMSLVRLAEDMAAASGGTKSISDAMEALADAKLGEMERLKEFGFKVSADEFKQKGFEGVSKDLENFYGGAAAKLATTGTGLLSTITGKLKSGVADFGLNIVEQLKPVFTNIIGLIDKAMPYVQEFGVKFGEGLGKGIQYISSIMPSFINGFKMMMPAIQSIILGVQQMLPPIMAFGGTIITTIQNVVIKATPIIDQIIQAIARILPAVQPIFSTIVTTIGNIVTTVLPPLGTAFSMIADVIVAIAPIISDTFSAISEVVTNAISGISSVIQGGLELISAIWSGSWQGVVDAFGSIFGGIAEICKAPMNAVIAIINGAIRAINSISVDIPAWVPVVGGQHWGLSLGQIPYLAKGGVVNEATTAVIGEAGKEVVMPLERNTGWIGNLAGQIMSRMTGFSIQLPTVSKDIPMTNGNTMSPASSGKTLSVVITIAKLAESIVVKEKGDIDDIAEEVADKILEVVENL